MKLIATFIFFQIYLFTNLMGQVSHNFEINMEELILQLAYASDEDIKQSVAIQLPNHVGTSIKFDAYKSSILSKEMEKDFPDFMTYSVRGVTLKNAYGRIFVSRFGLYGTLIIGSYRVVIEPIDPLNPILHKAYLYEGNETLECKSSNESVNFRGQFKGTRNPNGEFIRTYEMAITTTGEFYENANFGNSNNAQTNAAITNIINTINVYWNVEMSILLTIFQNPIIYTDPATDPFFISAVSNILDETGVTIHNAYPTGGYDLGHCLHALQVNGSGKAGIKVVCNNTFSSSEGRAKARGYSSASNQNLLSQGIMVHEVGHMFGAEHTFNGSQNSCNTSNHSLKDAVEIGSGTTIMSYAGDCDSHNVQGTEDMYFHAKSLENFYNHITSVNGNCSTNTSSNNTPPTVDATICSGPFTIPKMTPFELIGSGTDSDGDQVYYTWEQIDEDGATTRPTHGFIGSTAGNSNLAPLFRSYPPSSTGYRRVFPSMSLVVANSYSTSFEPLPNVGRTLNFRLTARDITSPFGAYAYDDIAIDVNNSAGPLTVTAPNTAITLTAGTNTNITWTVNNTNTICNTVNILLSIDGGYTYPYVLVSNTPNDGAQSVTIASNVAQTSMARIKVESACWTCVKFFDISNVDFTINSSCPVVSTLISPADEEVFSQGSPELDLNLTNDLGQPISNIAGSITSDDLSGGLVFLDGNPAVCASLGTTVKYDVLLFSVDVSGNYTINHGGTFGTVLNLYLHPISGMSCSNHLKSSATRPSGSGSIFLSSGLTHSLVANQLYALVVSSFSSGSPSLPFNYNITFPSKPTGSTIYNGIIPPNNCSYTYLAVNNQNQNIAVVDSGSDFTSLDGGEYSIYGLSYFSGSANPPGSVNPASFVGQPLGNIFTSGACALLSTNIKPITVVPICSSVISNANENGPGSINEAITCNDEDTIITFDPSVTQIVLSSALVIDKNLTFQGINNTQRPELILSTSGISISNGKTLTLDNVDLKQTAGTTVNGLGNLNIKGLTQTKD